MNISLNQIWKGIRLYVGIPLLALLFTLLIAVVCVFQLANRHNISLKEMINDSYDCLRDYVDGIKYE